MSNRLAGLVLASIACASPARRPIAERAQPTSTPCPPPVRDAKPADDERATDAPPRDGYDFSTDVIDGELLCPEGADGPTPSECAAAKQRARERDARDAAGCAR